MEIIDLINAFSQEKFISFILLILFIVYGFFAVVLSIQISTYNKVITQVGFAPTFQFVSYINVGLTLLLIFLTILTL